jgi:transcriptional regulator of aromatic amino acid metabolism
MKPSPTVSSDCTTLPVNTLITGNPASRRTALAMALGRAPLRVHVRRAADDLQMDDVTEGVVIIHDVGTLSTERQGTLLRWMEGAGSRVRVIALAERPLYSLVEQQRFRADLYYRLCVVQKSA